MYVLPLWVKNNLTKRSNFLAMFLVGDLYDWMTEFLFGLTDLLKLFLACT